MDIQRVTEDVSSDDLACIVENIVERPCPNVVLCSIEVVELVSIKPVGCKKHGKEAYDVFFGSQAFPKTEKLALPRRVLHQNYVRQVLSDNGPCVYKRPREAGTEEGQYHESDVGAIIHVAGFGV